MVDPLPIEVPVVLLVGIGGHIVAPGASMTALSRRRSPLSQAP